MILIPGFLSSGAVWDGMLAHYRSRYTCHVLTLPGFHTRLARKPSTLRNVDQWADPELLVAARNARRIFVTVRSDKNFTGHSHAVCTVRRMFHVVEPARTGD